MVSSRFQNKITGMLSGWYTEEWEKTIVWSGSNLMVKDMSIAEEILYNLEKYGIEADIQVSSDPIFRGWEAKLVFVS